MTRSSRPPTLLQRRMHGPPVMCLVFFEELRSHDSLPFFVENFFPPIQFVRNIALEYEKQQRMELATNMDGAAAAVLACGRRILPLPRIITKDSFREIAKQLVGLMSHPLFVDTSATALHVLCYGYPRACDDGVFGR
ncbi:hypothetical protein TcBrA4_0008030 [Trypanosoma cruzi]|nr:hypothetical protein TcBrA4_0008030 [Trypanosoma cruzi]